MNSPRVPTYCRLVSESSSATVRGCQVFKERAEAGHNCSPGGKAFPAHPRAWPTVQIAAVMFKVATWREVARVILVVFAFTIFLFMLQLITILNRCHHFPGFCVCYEDQTSNMEHFCQLSADSTTSRKIRPTEWPSYRA